MPFYHPLISVSPATVLQSLTCTLARETEDVSSAPHLQFPMNYRTGSEGLMQNIRGELHDGVPCGTSSVKFSKDRKTHRQTERKPQTALERGNLNLSGNIKLTATAENTINHVTVVWHCTSVLFSFSELPLLTEILFPALPMRTLKVSPVISQWEKYTW